MKFVRRHREEPEITLTPLIDIVFLMLIFFMVSTTFMRESAIEIALPEASERPVQQSTGPIILSINARGSFFLDGRALVNSQRDTVRRALEQARAADSDRPLLIQADADARHQSLVTAMDAAGQAGISQISIATLRDQATP